MDDNDPPRSRSSWDRSSSAHSWLQRGPSRRLGVGVLVAALGRDGGEANELDLRLFLFFVFCGVNDDERHAVGVGEGPTPPPPPRARSLQAASPSPTAGVPAGRAPCTAVPRSLAVRGHPQCHAALHHHEHGRICPLTRFDERAHRRRESKSFPPHSKVLRPTKYPPRRRFLLPHEPYSIEEIFDETLHR
jgi:hypothetical protein